MIKKLRNRFIRTVMTAFLAVLILLLVCLNGIYRHDLYADIDKRLVYLAESAIGPPQGMIDITPEQMRGWLDLNDVGIMSETSYFIFSGFMTLDVRQQSTELLSLALGQDANEVIRGILLDSRSFGNVGQYRYYCTGRSDPYKLVFLRCENEFTAMRSLLSISVLVGIVFFLLVFTLTTLLSRRATRPFAENMENQKRFISNASHELKTPLGVIVSDLDMQTLETGPSEWIENAQLQADHLALLIEQLTTYALLDEKRQQAADVPVDLAALGHSLLSEFRPLALSRGLQVAEELTPGTCARGNEDAFRTLLSVLLENAVKYTREGGYICLRVRRERHAVLEVENDCGALETEQLERLFERFYRAPEHRPNHRGTGLGLSIAREIAQLYGGTLRASKNGDALVFTAELPMEGDIL